MTTLLKIGTLIALLMAVTLPAYAGCETHCKPGEVYSDELESCVAKPTA